MDTSDVSSAAVSEVNLLDETDWDNLKVLLRNMKGGAWSQDPFVKKPNLKAPYKPENLSFDMLARVEDRDSDDDLSITKLKQNVVEAPKRGATEPKSPTRIIRRVVKAVGPKVNIKKDPHAAVHPRDSGVRSPPGKARSKKKDLKASFGTIGVLVLSRRRPLPVEHEPKEQQLQLLRRRRMEETQIGSPILGQGPAPCLHL